MTWRVILMTWGLRRPRLVRRLPASGQSGVRPSSCLILSTFRYPCGFLGPFFLGMSLLYESQRSTCLGLGCPGIDVRGLGGGMGLG